MFLDGEEGNNKQEKKVRLIYKYKSKISLVNFRTLRASVICENTRSLVFTNH
jgi:hypothetical protein